MSSAKMGISQLLRRGESVFIDAPLKSFFILFMLGGVTGTISQLALYLRPTPGGLPFVLDIPHYLPHAIFYEWYGMALLSMPFFLIALLLKTRGAKACLWIHGTCITLSLLTGVIHAELQRHMGIRFSLDWLATYSNLNNVPHSIWGSIANDDGGAYSTIIVLGIPFIFVGGTLAAYRKLLSIRLPRPVAALTTVTVLCACCFLPFLMRTSYFGSKNRQYKVQPPVLVIRDEIIEQLKPLKTFSDIERHIDVVQNKWMQSEGDEWFFDGSEFPLQKN